MANKIIVWIAVLLITVAAMSVLLLCIFTPIIAVPMLLLIWIFTKQPHYFRRVAASLLIIILSSLGKCEIPLPIPNVMDNKTNSSRVSRLL